MLIGGLAAACAAPAGGVVGLGTHTGQIAVSPVTFYYDGTAGERLNVGVLISHYDVEPIDDWTEVRAPDGTALIPLIRSGTSQQVDLPTTGRYRVVLHMVPASPTDAGAKNFRMDLSHDEYRGAVALGPIPAPPFIFQRWSFTYAGTAAEGLNVFNAVLTEPGGTQHDTGHYGSLHLALPVTDGYTVTVGGNHGMLSHDIDGGTAALGANQSPVPLVNGQRVVFTYAGTAGEALGIGTTDTSVGGNVTPSGGTMTAANISPAYDRYVLPETGTYTFMLTPRAFVSSPAKLWLTHDRDGGALVPGDNVVTGLLHSQSVAFTYEGTAGDTLKMYPQDNAPGTLPRALLADPGGNPLAPSSYDGSYVWILPSTGTYHMVVTPQPAASSVTATVWINP
jgi:hypothetical protein